MKTVLAIVLLILSTIFTATGFARDTCGGQSQLCQAAAAQMVRFPGQEESICSGYPGCEYIPPSYTVGKCIASKSRPSDWQSLCDAAAAQMAQFRGQEERICAGYPGCNYIAPKILSGRCVERQY